MQTDTEKVVTFLRQWADHIEQRGVSSMNSCSWHRLNPTTGSVNGVRQVGVGLWHVLNVIVELEPRAVPDGN